MKRSIILAVIVCAVPVLADDNLNDVMKHMTKPNPAAVKAYLTDHPDAPDEAKAERVLAILYSMTGRREEAIKTFQHCYEKLVAKKDAASVQDIRDAIRDWLDACIEAGQREHAKAMIARIEKDFAGNKDEKRILAALDIPRDELKIPLVGETMEIAFKAMDGRDVDLAALKGKVVLVEYWATNCLPCVAEIPTIKKVYDRSHDKGFEVIAISLDDDKAKLESFLKKRDLPWPQSFTSGQESHWKAPLVAKYGIHSIPQLFLIDKQGKIVAVNPRGPGELEKKVSETLGKPAL